GAEGPVFSQYRESERQFVVRDDYPLGQRRLTSLSGRVLDVGSVDGQNDVTHFVDELEDGEGGFGWPACRDAEWDGDRQTRVGPRRGASVLPLTKRGLTVGGFLTSLIKGKTLFIPRYRKEFGIK